MNPPLLTPEEVANELKLATKTVKDMLRDGRLKGIKIEKLWRVHPDDLKAYIEKQRNK